MSLLTKVRQSHAASRLRLHHPVSSKPRHSIITNYQLPKTLNLVISHLCVVIATVDYLNTVTAPFLAPDCDSRPRW